MLKIAVCDDEQSIREELKDLIEAFFEGKEEVEVSLYGSGIELTHRQECFALIFLDIEMPDMDGIETAKKIRAYDKKVSFIYVTSHKNYYQNAYQVHAFEYIVKPFLRERVEEVLKDWMEFFDDGKSEPVLLETELGMRVEHIENIYYFMVLKKGQVMVCTETEQYIIKGKIADIYQIVDKSMFFMSNRSFLVNLQHVKGYQDFEIQLCNQDTVPLARRRKNEFMQALHEWILRYRR